MKKLIVITGFILSLLLSSCGGGGGGGSVDTTPPVITIFGDNPAFIEVGDYYVDGGASATDDTDGTVTVSIVTNDVNSSNPGTYHVVYRAVDTAGNKTEATRTVFVLSATDKTPPVITLIGNNPATIRVGQTYTDAGASAIDDTDGNISGMVATSGAVNNNRTGTYTLFYNVTDSAGNAAVEVNRTVVVAYYKKTGQTRSFSTYDDGYYQTGVDARYSRDSTKEIVTDLITGLRWQDNSEANTTMKPWITEDNYNKCYGINGEKKDEERCHDVSGDTAATYCDKLILGGFDDWRLPSIKELYSIHNNFYIQNSQGVNIDPVFMYTTSEYAYWSITPLAIDENPPGGGATAAWMVSDRGRTFWYYGNNPRRVRCVLGGN